MFIIYAYTHIYNIYISICRMNARILLFQSGISLLTVYNTSMYAYTLYSGER